MKTVAILEGWAGGSWHLKRFNKALRVNGYQTIKNAAEADIIIAHSAGCYRFPPRSKAKQVMLLGPPYWPGKSIISRAFKKKGHDTYQRLTNQGLVFAINKIIFEIIYVIAKPSYTLIALKNHQNLSFLDLLDEKRVILVRNNKDSLCTPEIEDAVKDRENIRYQSMPGGHDDFMTNPQPYIDLLK